MVGIVKDVSKTILDVAVLAYPKAIDSRTPLLVCGIKEQGTKETEASGAAPT